MASNIEEKEEQEAPILQLGSQNSEMAHQRSETLRKIFRGEHNYLLSALCVSFGMSTWLPVNSVYSQMPLLTQYAPESWNLASYFSVVVQIANIAPLGYYFVRDRKWCPDSVLICLFLLLGTIASVFLSFTYHVPVSIFGAQHSFFFFFFAFFLSMVGCVSSVLFLPFMGRLPEVYLVSFFIGEGLSGFIPSFLALLQGVAKDPVCISVNVSGVITKQEVMKEPLFSSGLFFFIISTIMLFNTLCFLYLNYFSNLMSKYSVTPNPASNSEEINVNSSRNHETEDPDIPKFLLIVLLVVVGIINCFSNGILPSIMSYSCLPYGPETYHWSLNINMIIGPLSSYFAYFIPLVSVRLLAFCCIVEILCINYELITAFSSPFPPLIGTDIGVVIIILVWMFGAGLISYIKLSIAAILRRRHKKALFNYGISTQIGSTIGALVAFILIIYANVLHSVPKKKCV
ncbi:solute carrier family 52, riboflavin transporter, member 3-A-like isoform X1 [Planococcus citri]|uniref:solute carrier family 52, riboflavin transporter, member 3-A-like isoform X1 n=2 Tax=Planococcus citri TaxID=170843 RepID=UPI0031F9FA6D